MDTGRTDLLLLNASNLPTVPIFPYAFVQVSAIARRFGLNVARFDFLGAPKPRWQSLLADLIRTHRPRMVGLHLRQRDSVVGADYLPPPDGDPSTYYLPVDETRDLVRMVRGLTDVPVVAGGFGFTALALKTASALGVDFGVQGEPDGFFERFDDVLAGNNLDAVPNLVYRKDGNFVANPRVFYSPSPAGEYNDEILAELIRFYGDRTLLAGTMPHVPVEIARGCPFHCYFCNEPTVKGRTVRYRDWSAVEADLAFLDRNGIRRIWLVCSEINIHPAKAKELAARMAALNNGRSPGDRIRWRAYNIPRMNTDDLRTMLDAGFEPGWNDFPSFDDQNLAECRVPFRSEVALSYYRSFLDWADAQPATPDNRSTFYIFLGNAFADASSIRTTLEKVESHGLQARHERAAVSVATRVFENDGKLICGDRQRLSSVGRNGKVPFDPVQPSYYYPPKLVKHLGNEQSVREFLDYVGSTFLSTAYEQTRHWSAFLAESISPAGLLALMQDAKSARGISRIPIDTDDVVLAGRIRQVLRSLWRNLSVESVRPLFFPGEQQALYNYVAEAVLAQLLRPHAREFKRVLDFLEIPHDRNGFHSLSPYALAKIFYQHYDGNDELIESVCRSQRISRGSLDLLALKSLLHQSNVRIRPEYRALLFG
jgi:hypothetical protein